jgi:alpha-L-fucosidase
MSAVGRWMAVNAESIRGTDASPVGKASFDGRFTVKGGVRYAHVFEKPGDGVIKVPFKATKATLLAGGGALEVTPDGDGAKIALPATMPDADATVIRIE